MFTIDYYDESYDEIPKYKKKAKKKKIKKANHKHDYVEVIGKYIEQDGKSCVFPAKRCNICGKAERTLAFFTREEKYNGKNYYELLSNENEVKKLHPELDIVEVDKLI